MNPVIRLWASAIIALVANGGWSFFANSLVTDDMSVIIRSAIVQGGYSSIITLLFTWVLERTYNRASTKYISFAFVVPLVCFAHHKTLHASIIRKSFNNALDTSASWFDGLCWPSVVFAPLLPLSIQTTLVVSVNLLNQTPNLALTVAPSILFSALYGYMYTLYLYKQNKSGSD